jgi:hypothetical protein
MGTYIKTWSLDVDENSPKLPVLKRLGSSYSEETPGAYGETSGDMPTDFIDIIRDYNWTRSPKTSRMDVGKFFLYEKRIKTNSILSNLANQIESTSSDILTVGSNTNTAIDAVNNLIKKGANELGFDTNTVSKAFSLLQSGVTLGANEIRELGQKALKIRKPFEADSQFAIGGTQVEDYKYLYLTKETGFKYILPYFNDVYTGLQNSFGEDSGLLEQITDITNPITANIADIANVTKPGTYIERSKQFNMTDQGRSIEIKFPLLNTVSFDDIRSNWELLFGLIYQNRPGRISRSAIDLPVIYEVYSPGVAYMPYAYISNLSINFVGSRREMTLPSPFGPASLNTIIPDAYIVNITLTGLNEETRNFIYTSVANKITVSQVPLPVQVTKAPADVAPAVKPPAPPPSLVKNNPAKSAVSPSVFPTLNGAAAADLLNPNNRSMGSGGPGLFYTPGMKLGIPLR